MPTRPDSRCCCPGFMLAAGCVLIGLFGASVVRSMGPLISSVTGLPPILDRPKPCGARSLGRARRLFWGGADWSSRCCSLSDGRWRLRGVRSAPPRPGTAGTHGRRRGCSTQLRRSRSRSQRPSRCCCKRARVFTAPRGLFPQQAEFHTQTDDPYQTLYFSTAVSRDQPRAVFAATVAAGESPALCAVYRRHAPRAPALADRLNDDFGFATSTDVGGSACSTGAGGYHPHQVCDGRSRGAAASAAVPGPMETCAQGRRL